MNTRMLTGALFAAVFAACGPGVDSYWETEPNITGPLDLGGQVAYVDKTNGRLFMLDPTRNEAKAALKVARYDAGKKPGAIAVSADKSALYIVDEEGDQLRIVAAR